MRIPLAKDKSLLKNLKIKVEEIIMSEDCMNDEFELLSEGVVKYYASLILEGNPDPEFSSHLLKIFCVKAKKLSSSEIPAPIIEIIVLAFEKYLSGDEKNINKSLGLIRRGKPKSRKVEDRNILIAADVERLIRLGVTKTLSKTSDGAFYIISKKYNLSESEIEDIYYKNKDMGIAIVQFENLDTDPV